MLIRVLAPKHSARRVFYAIVEENAAMLNCEVI